MAKDQARKKVVIISYLPPTFDNLDGPGGLPYQIIDNAPEDIDIHLYYYDDSGRDQEYIKQNLEKLGLKSYKLLKPKNRFTKIKKSIDIQGLTMRLGKFLAPDRAVREINNLNPDHVWIYSIWMADWISKLDCKSIVISGMDSVSLYHKRLLQLPGINEERQIHHRKMLERTIELEKYVAESNAIAHFVGTEDLKQYQQVTGAQGFYTPYFYFQSDYLAEKITQESKLKVLITGNADSLYLGELFRQLVDAFLNSQDRIKHKVSITFRGNNFEPHFDRMRQAGLDVSIQGWVDNYAEFLATFPVQIFPIQFGTGTKGKVLQAMATRQLAIGTEIAFENIGVEHYQTGLVFRDSLEVIDLLEGIVSDPERFNQISARGAQLVRNNFDPKSNSVLFWNRLLEDN